MSLISSQLSVGNTVSHQTLSYAHSEISKPYESAIFSLPKIAEFFKDTSHNLSHIHQLVNSVALTGFSHMRERFYKPTGYFGRLFSDESWSEWAENLTPLGRVVSSILDNAQSSTSEKISIAKEDLLRANRDARKALDFVDTSLFPAQVNLASLGSTRGIAIQGTNVQNLGITIGSLGDINGDNLTDMYIGSSSNGYVVFGGKTLTSPIDLTKLDGKNGFVIIAPFSDVVVSSPMAHAGDVNGDGIDDILFSADDGLGSCYLIFGKKQWPPIVNVTQLDGKNGTVLHGEKRDDDFGEAISGAKDINNDGIDDFMIGAPGTGLAEDLSKVYVIFGHAGVWQKPFNISTLDGSNGFVIQGENNQDGFGISIAPLGDVNGDGKPDIIIGAPAANLTSSGGSLGRTYIVYGRTGPFTKVLEAATLSGNTGCIFVGAPEDLASGEKVSGLGDVDGDGINDFGIGAPASSYGATSIVGKAYIVFGTNETRRSPFSLADIDGKNGCIIIGTEAFSDLGQSIGSAGDINGDGFKDVAVGAPLGFVENGVGVTLIVFGHNGTWEKAIGPMSLNGMNGFIANGVDSLDSCGDSVGAIHDFNGDGLDDVAIGAPGGDSGVGAGYIIYGRDQKSLQEEPPSALPVILGTTIAVGGAVALAAGLTIVILRLRKKSRDPGEEIPLV